MKTHTSTNDALPGASARAAIPTLSLALALQLIGAALARPRESAKAMAIVVLDGAGQPLASVREDGASPLRLEIAAGKAAAAFGMGVNTRVLSERAGALPIFFGAIAAASRQPFIPHVGAVLIRDAEGSVLGAVGASGGTGDEDERLCIDALGGIGLRHG